MPFAYWIQGIQALLGNQEDFGKLNELLQHQLGTLNEYCNAFRNDFETYLETTKQKLKELSNEISELERQQQEIQNTVKAVVSNLDTKAKSADFELGKEKEDDNYEVKLLSETLKLLDKFDKCMQIIEGMLDELLKQKASEVGKYIKDVAALKASREKCYAVLKYTNLSLGVLDCLCDYLRISIEAVDTLSKNMVSLGDSLLHQPEGSKQSFNI
jgi:DNA repair exonuclease SbcCD ATPase subunit